MTLFHAEDNETRFPMANHDECIDECRKAQDRWKIWIHLYSVIGSCNFRRDSIDKDRIVRREGFPPVPVLHRSL